MLNIVTLSLLFVILANSWGVKSRINNLESNLNSAKIEINTLRNMVHNLQSKENTVSQSELINDYQIRLKEIHTDTFSATFSVSVSP